METMFSFPVLSFIRCCYSESSQKNISYLKLDVATSYHWRRFPCCLRQRDDLISFLILCFAVLQFVKIQVYSVLMLSQWCCFSRLMILSGIYTCNLSIFRETRVRKMVFIKAVLTSGSKLLTTSAASIYHQHFKFSVLTQMKCCKTV